MATEKLKRRRAPAHYSVAERLAFHSMRAPVSGCLLWTACISGSGYGQIGIEGRMRSAHRVAWEKEHGPIPPGMQVCHRCDVPRCIEPAHLFLGTNSDNMRDCSTKGRIVHGDRHWSRATPERRPRGDGHGSQTRPESRPRGERNGSAKLTEAAVRAIRADPRLLREIAADYGVDRTVVGSIKRRETWQHLD